MNGKDLEKALLWEAPHIGEKAPVWLLMIAKQHNALGYNMV